MKSTHLLYGIIVLLIALAAQTWYIKKIQNEVFKDQLNEAIKLYQTEQAERDSINSVKLDLILASDFKIKERYYHTKEVVKQNREDLANETDSSLTNTLISLIEQRKRSGNFTKGQSN